MVSGHITQRWGMDSEFTTTDHVKDWQHHNHDTLSCQAECNIHIEVTYEMK